MEISSPALVEGPQPLPAHPGRPPGTAGRDQQYHVLTTGCPPYPGVARHARWGLPVYRGRRLPPALADFAAPRHSWERLVQDVLNGVPPSSVRERKQPELRDYQLPRVEKMRAAFLAGAPGFLLADPTGSGKTPMAITTVSGLPVQLVLVVTKLSVVPAWRAAIDYFGTGAQRWVVINPEQMWRLFEHPWHPLATLPADEAAAIAAQSGRCRVDFGAVITDESHILADPMSIRSRMHARIMDQDEGRRPWWLRLSATPFTAPHETRYAADLIAHVTGAEEPGDVDRGDYLDWLRGECGFQLNTDTGGRWHHVDNAHDVDRVKELLYDSAVGASSSPRELGLPDQARELRPVELSAEDYRKYTQAWREFRQAVGLAIDDTDDDGDGRQAALRRVQRASFLKVPQVAAVVADLVADGYQVCVPTWFLETVRALVEHIAWELKSRSLPDRVVDITGEDVGLRERKRQAFQLGRCKVVVFNALEGINLHAGERNVDGVGTDATSAPRATVVADVLTGGKRTLQAEGRASRDGQHALAVYVYVAGTTEEAWLARMLRSASNTQALARASADARALTELADQLDAHAGNLAEVPA
ncbi:DEAD/DEAH box helicase family protein [Streptomyces canus]|uniref:DEAD/DEAH box helicase family protein n=1 Tax=Streptomyces canus TaxID=58343 RepID=UPI0036E18EE8